MKLRNQRESPPNGGFFFITEDNKKITASTLRLLAVDVSDYLSANNLSVPDDLRKIIEDQICSRLPNKYCWKGFGDFVAGAIQAVAGAADSVLGTNLKTAAKSCSGCAARKRKLNR